MSEHLTASPHQSRSAAPSNAKRNGGTAVTKLQSVNLTDCTLNEVNGIQNNNVSNTNIHNYVSRFDKTAAELNDFEDDQRILKKTILTSPCPSVPERASALKTYLQNLRCISDLNPNTIPQYAKDDAKSFIPLLQSEDHDTSLLAIEVLEFYAFHHVGWRPVTDQRVITALVLQLSSVYPDVQLIAAKIISKLSPHRSVSEMAFKSGVIQYIVPLLRDFDCPELQKANARSLVHIVYDEISRLEALKQGAFKALVPLLDSDIIVHDAVVALYSISTDLNRISFADLYPISFANVRPLIALLKRDTTAKTRISALLVLHNLTPHIVLSSADVQGSLFRDLLTAFESLGGDSQAQSPIIGVLGNLGKNYAALGLILPNFAAILPQLSDPDTRMLFCDTLLAIIPTRDVEATRIAENAELLEKLKSLLDGSSKSDLQKKVLLVLSRLRSCRLGDREGGTFNFRKFFRFQQI